MAKIKTVQMMEIQKSSGSGSIHLPPSKSHTQRAILFALMGKGISTLYNYLHSPDIEAMLKAVEQLGATIVYRDPYQLKILGVDGFLKTADDVIHAGNSGQVLRFIGALSSLLPTYTILTGDPSIRTNRPVKPLLEGIRQLKGFAVSAALDDTAPIVIKGPILPGKITIDGQCSQAVSGFLIACSFLSGPSEITVTNAGEKPWLSLTLSWLNFLGLKYTQTNLEHFILEGKGSYAGFSYTIPGDISSAAFPIGAALATDSCITLKNIDRNSHQGDIKLLEILTSMGAIIEFSQKQQTVTIQKSPPLLGGSFDVNECIDAIPILSVLGCLCKAPLILKGAHIARKKESNRLACMTSQLKKMGASIEEKEDGLTIYPSSLTGTKVHSFYDHRVAMALSVAGLYASGTTYIEEVGCIKKSYPNYTQDLGSLGFQVREILQ